MPAHEAHRTKSAYTTYIIEQAETFEWMKMVDLNAKNGFLPTRSNDLARFLSDKRAVDLVASQLHSGHDQLQSIILNKLGEISGYCNHVSQEALGKYRLTLERRMQIHDVLCRILAPSLNRLQRDPMPVQAFFTLAHNLIHFAPVVGDQQDTYGILMHTSEQSHEPVAHYVHKVLRKSIRMHAAELCKEYTQQYDPSNPIDHVFTALVYMLPDVQKNDRATIQAIRKRVFADTPDAMIDALKIPVEELQHDILRTLLASGLSDEEIRGIVGLWNNSDESRLEHENMIRHASAALELWKIDRRIPRLLTERAGIINYDHYPTEQLIEQITTPIQEPYILVVMAQGSHNAAIGNAREIERYRQLRASLPPGMHIRYVETQSAETLGDIPDITDAISTRELPVGIIFDSHGYGEGLSFSKYFGGTMTINLLRSTLKTEHVFTELFSQCREIFLWACETANDTAREPLARSLSLFAPHASVVASEETMFGLALLEANKDLSDGFTGFDIQTDQDVSLVRYKNGKRLTFDTHK